MAKKLTTLLRSFISFLLFLTLGNMQVFAQNSSAINIRNYGASNLGKQRIDSALSSAIRLLATKGGGTINFPDGIYLSGPIKLESHIILHLDKNAQIKFTTDSSAYLNKDKLWLPLISMDHIIDAGITGEGSLDGQVSAWQKDLKKKQAKKEIESKSVENIDSIINDSTQNLIPVKTYPVYPDHRPSMIQITNSSEIQLEGIRILNSPNIAINQVNSRTINLERLRITNPDTIPSTAIRSDLSSNISISASQLTSAGDGIQICSHSNNDSLLSKNILISNCSIIGAVNDIWIENDSQQALANISINNCLFSKSRQGFHIRLQPDDNTLIRNLEINNLILDSIQESAFLISIPSTIPDSINSDEPLFDHVHFSEITGQAGQAGNISVKPSVNFGDLSFQNINLNTNLGFSINGASGVSFESVTINNTIGPSLLIKHSQRLNIHDFCNNTPQPQTPVIRLENASKIHIYDCFQEEPTFVFVEEKQNTCSDIYLTDNILDQVETPVIIH